MTAALWDSDSFDDMTFRHLFNFYHLTGSPQQREREEDDRAAEITQSARYECVGPRGVASAGEISVKLEAFYRS